MCRNSFSFGPRGFLIRKLRKDVDVGENGHGTVNYEIRLARKNMKMHCIDHQLGGGESIPADIRLGTLKVANKAFEQGSELDVFRGYSFAAKSMVSSCKKLVWKELLPYRGFRRFEIDFQKTYGRAEDISYGYGWTHPKMFAGTSPKGELSSSVCVRYPTELLTLSIHFPAKYPLKHDPKLEVFDFNGNKLSTKIKYELDEPLENMFDLRFYQVFGKHYRVTIQKPPQGYIFKTVWRIKKP